jgi:hypothetical protein
MLLRNVSYIDAYTTLELFNDFCGKRKFQRHEYPQYRKLIYPIKRYCDMELKHNLLVKQYCNDEMILCSKAYDHQGYHCKPSNENHSTFEYDVKKTCETNIVFDGLHDLRCIRRK